MWILRYYRYHSLQEYEGDTKEECLNFGVNGEEEGELSMHELVSPDGEVVMNKKQLFDHWLNQP